MSASEATPDSSTADAQLIRSSGWVASGTALSRATGLIRVAALTYAVGQTKLGDLYTFANFAPNLVFELVIGGALSATLIPAFVTARDEDDDAAVSSLFSTGIVASLVLTLAAFALVGVGALIARAGVDTEVVGAAARRAAEHELHRIEVAAGLLFLMLPQVLFYGVSTLGTAYLNASRRYGTAAFAPVFTNLFTIVAFVIAGRQLQGQRGLLDVEDFRLAPLLWLGLGTTGGIVAMTLPVLLEIRRSGARLSFRPTLRHPAVRKVTRLSLWTFGYVAANQVALLVVYLVALRSGSGIAKRYSDAFIFFQLPHGLIAVSVMTTMTPELASAAGRGDLQGLADRFARGLRLLAVLIIPAAAGYAVLGTPIASMLFERGQNFSAADAEATGRTIAAFALGLPAFSTYLFANRGFYALSDTRTPFFTNLIENIINVIGVVIVVAAGVSSSVTLALVYGIAYIIAAGLALRRLDAALRARDRTVRRPDLSPILRMAAATVAMTVVVLLVRQVFDANHGGGAWVSVLASLAAGLVAYVAAGTALGIDEVRSAVTAARRLVPSRSH